MKYKESADRLKLALYRNNMKAQDLADRSGVSKSSISHYVNGSNVPSAKNARLMASVLSVNPMWLMGVDAPMNSISTKDAIGSYKIPVVATVAAGTPIFAEDSIVEYIDYKRPSEGDIFAMYIHGDSMEPLIHDGDTVIVDRSASYDSGDIVVVAINGNEGCCKRYKRYKDSIALVSLNTKYDPLFFTEKEIDELPVAIIGRVVESRSKF